MINLIYILALLFGFIVWYFYYGLECYLNGGFTSGGNHWTCFKQDFEWFFGGKKAKGNYIFNLIKDNDGYISNWSYEEIREKNLYEKVGIAVLPGPLHFLGTHVFIPLLPTLFVFLSKWCFFS